MFGFEFPDRFFEEVQRESIFDKNGFEVGDFVQKRANSRTNFEGSEEEALDKASFVFAVGKRVVFHEQTCVCFFAEGLCHYFICFWGPSDADIQEIDPLIFL